MMKYAVLHISLTFLLAPVLPGIINRTKAFFGGRRGQPVFQLYYDLYKLINKAAVYSRTTTWLFRSGPLAGLASVMTTAFIVPYGGFEGILSFNGDLVLVCYLFALARFFTVLAALDTASSFEGMGASREVQFAVLAEPAFFLALAALARYANSISLAGIYSAVPLVGGYGQNVPLVLFAATAMFLVFLAENSRVPVDDPNTHLELTMIHEAMVLDHCGVDLAFILYGSALKFWVMGAMIVGLFINPSSGGLWAGTLIFIAGMSVLAVLVGIIESIMARFRMNKVPQMLVAAIVLSVLALMVQAR